MLWLDALHQSVKLGQACVLVAVSEVQGSAPRRVGARMLVTANTVVDTIGGGALEQQAIERARSTLAVAGSESLIESHSSVLGTELSQCCGGRVTLSYEYHPAAVLNLVVFGAGHVAQSVAKILLDLPCRAQFIDSRKTWLDKLPCSADSTGTINKIELQQNPFMAVEHCPDNAFYLVMTHSHELDFDIVEAILSRGDSAYCGLIASKSKSAKFRSRLSRKGFTESEIKKLTSPIGVDQHCGNLPMEVAIAAVNELLQVRDRRAQRAVVPVVAQE